MADYGNSGTSITLDPTSVESPGDIYSYTPPTTYDYSSPSHGGQGIDQSSAANSNLPLKLGEPGSYTYHGSDHYDYTTANMPQAGVGIGVLDLIVPPPSGPRLKVHRNGAWVDID